MFNPKRVLHLLIAVVSCYALFFACKSSVSGDGNVEEASKIEISWEVISNFGEGNTPLEAKFIFENKSNYTLGDSGWALYYNISPRAPIAHPQPQPATITHINGDWFRLDPKKGFKLAPGEKIEVKYLGDAGVIKETDGPLGVYFVFTEKDGAEKIVAVEKTTVIPFTRNEQILRGPNDKDLPYSAAVEFDRNKVLSLTGPENTPAIIPSPVLYQKKQGSYALNSTVSIYYAAGLKNEASILAEKLKLYTGTDFKINEGTGDGIVLSMKSNPKKESYQLDITDKGIAIAGSDAAGVFYGIQSLLSMIPNDVYLAKKKEIVFSQVHIEDAPRFAFRSLHLDLARNFQTKETVLKVLDLLASYKINHILFYTTEDEGWRVEIDGLPELTSVGATRKHVAGMQTAALHPAYGSGPTTDYKNGHGQGFYSKADFVEILKFATSRHITVIPLINFPGHARAAIKSMEARYGRLKSEGKDKEAEEYRLIDPLDSSVYISAQGYKDNVVDVTRESTYHFFEKVVDGLMSLYKEAGLTMNILHIGGDEVPDAAWTKSPNALALLKSNPEIKNTKNLHPYFVRTVLPRLLKRNLKVHGWEEIALIKTPEGKYISNPEFVKYQIVPYIWNNVFDPDLGYRLANSGYPIVLCNVTNMYFDLAYNNDPREPGLYWGGFVDTWDNYAFAPYDMFKTTFTNGMGQKINFDGLERLKPEARKNIIGLEAQLWSETVKGQQMLEYYILPKLFGFAESAWSTERVWETIENEAERNTTITNGWNMLANTIGQKEMARLSFLNGGYNYRVPTPGLKVEGGKVFANSTYPGLNIHFTTDGSEPTTASPLYNGPIASTGKVKVKCFDAAGKGSRVVQE
jgi:hexosaminidase